MRAYEWTLGFTRKRGASGEAETWSRPSKARRNRMFGLVVITVADLRSRATGGNCLAKNKSLLIKAPFLFKSAAQKRIFSKKTHANRFFQPKVKKPKKKFAYPERWRIIATLISGSVASEPSNSY